MSLILNNLSPTLIYFIIYCIFNILCIIYIYLNAKIELNSLIFKCLLLNFTLLKLYHLNCDLLYNLINSTAKELNILIIICYYLLKIEITYTCTHSIVSYIIHKIFCKLATTKILTEYVFSPIAFHFTKFELKIFNFSQHLTSLKKLFLYILFRYFSRILYNNFYRIRFLSPAFPLKKFELKIFKFSQHLTSLKKTFSFIFYFYISPGYYTTIFTEYFSLLSPFHFIKFELKILNFSQNLMSLTKLFPLYSISLLRQDNIYIIPEYIYLDIETLIYLQFYLNLRSQISEIDVNLIQNSILLTHLLMCTFAPSSPFALVSSGQLGTLNMLSARIIKFKYSVLTYTFHVHWIVFSKLLMLQRYLMIEKIKLCQFILRLKTITGNVVKLSSLKTYFIIYLNTILIYYMLNLKFYLKLKKFKSKENIPSTKHLTLT